MIESGKISGHDRGIDAIHIEQTEIKNKIHLFNFKYVETFEKTKSNFPANEIDKILGFLNALMSQDKKYLQEISPLLASKMNSIWEIFNTENPDFVIHICSNQYFPFEEQEKRRFEREVHKNSNFEIKYHLMDELVNLLTKKGKIKVNANIPAIDKQFFERSDGDVKALIVNVDVMDLLRICIDNEDFRNDSCLKDYNLLKNCHILNDAFEDNVRIYLKQRSKINKNIKNTALSGEGHRLFYYNNGITITCENFEYPGGNRRSPIIILSGLQIVNGSQTIHALFEAFQEDPSKFENMTILCRIYETRNKELSTNIAEYTNSQNPVNTRDIRSIDYNQIKLEKEFEAINYYYERKKGQYSNKPKNKRLDAEKVGQVLMAFYHKMPSEAKDKKRLIFAEKYEEIFDDAITANKILLPFFLFNNIENKKSRLRAEIFDKDNIDVDKYKRNGPLLYSSYWILYVLHEIAVYKKIDLIKENYEEIDCFYPIACQIINDIWNEEIKDEKEPSKIFAYEPFFKKNQPMKYIDKIFDSDKIKEYVN
ncbi:MAG: AIPR family protein [Nanoarchaeota archaeon]